MWLLRWSANQWLVNYDVEISELSFEGYSFKQLFYIDSFFDEDEQDFVQISQLRIQKIKRVKSNRTTEASTRVNPLLALSFLTLSDIRFILDYQSPYFIKAIELSSGLAMTSLDEIINLKVGLDANLATSPAEHSLDNNEATSPIDFAFLKSLPNIKINSIKLDVYSQHPISSNTLSSHSISSNASTNNTIRLSLNDSNIEFGQQIKATIYIKLADKHLLSTQLLEVNEHINGKLTLDLAAAAQLTQTFIDLPPYFLPINGQGLLSNTFDIKLKDQYWQINTSNIIADGKLNNALNGGLWGVNVDGNFDVDFTMSDLGSTLTVTTPKSEDIKVSLNTSSIDYLFNKLLGKLSEKLPEKKLSEHSTALLLAQLNQAVKIKIIKPVVFDMTNKTLIGDLNFKSYTDSGNMDVSVEKILVRDQQTEFLWQLNVEQQQPVEQISAVKFTSGGYFKQSAEAVMITVNDKSNLTLSTLRFKQSSEPDPEQSATLNLKQGANERVNQSANQGPEQKQPSVSAQKLTFELLKPAELIWQKNTLKLTQPLMFNSLVNQLLFKNNLIETLVGTHKVEQVSASIKSESEWTINNLLVLISHHELMNGLLTGEIEFKNSSVDDFSSWVALPELLFFNGKFSNHVLYQIKLADMQLSAEIHGKIIQGAGSYKKLLFRGVNANWQCQWRLSKLHCDDNNMTIDMLDGGADVSNLFVQSKFYWQKNQWELNVEQFKGDLFDGSFSTSTFKITPDLSFAGTVELQHFSLGEIVKLQQQKGINVNGFINGLLPFEYDRKGLTIHHGLLLNQADGLIQIEGNPAIEQLKLSQLKLKYALDALKELHFSVLQCDVNMQADGSTQIKMKIEGTNPDIVRPIHFNYLHEENLIQLFRSLQIGNVLNDKIDQSINNR